MLKKTCSACNKDRKKSKLVYDEGFRAYCLKPHECNEEHPNSTSNLIRNGRQATLFDYDNAVKRFASENTGETIRLLDAPVTIRLTDIQQAQFIERQCKELQVTTSEFIRSLIDTAMRSVVIETSTKQAKKEVAPETTTAPDSDDNGLTF
jgi:hypothetical protein